MGFCQEAMENYIILACFVGWWVGRELTSVQLRVTSDERNLCDVECSECQFERNETPAGKTGQICCFSHRHKVSR